MKWLLTVVSALASAAIVRSHMFDPSVVNKALKDCAEETKTSVSAKIKLIDPEKCKVIKPECSVNGAQQKMFTIYCSDRNDGKQPGLNGYEREIYFPVCTSGDPATVLCYRLQNHLKPDDFLKALDAAMAKDLAEIDVTGFTKYVVGQIKEMKSVPDCKILFGEITENSGRFEFHDYGLQCHDVLLKAELGPYSASRGMKTIVSNYASKMGKPELAESAALIWRKLYNAMKKETFTHSWTLELALVRAAPAIKN